MHLFVNESDDYCDWVAFGIALQKANLPIETFLEFSKLTDDKYDEKKTIRKWNSFKYQHNAGDLINKLKKKGIDVLAFSKNEIKHEFGVKSDLEAAQTAYKEYPYWKYCNDTLYVFNKLTGMW